MRVLEVSLQIFIASRLLSVDLRIMSIFSVLYSGHVMPRIWLKEIKRSSSLWIKSKSPRLQGFTWQKGYGVFSIGFSHIPALRDYIAGQEEHHRKVSFQDELRQFLRLYGIDFDERYLWD